MYHPLYVHALHFFKAKAKLIGGEQEAFTEVDSLEMYEHNVVDRNNFKKRKKTHENCLSCL